MPPIDIPFGSLFELVGAGAGAIAQGVQNRKSRDWSERMYGRQVMDSLAFWNMQNKYNTPAAQMQRYKDAGLNPNLIYGQSNVSGPISRPDMKEPEFKAADYSGIGRAGGRLLDMYDIQIKQAQTDNLKDQNTVLQEEAALKRAQTLNVLKNTDRTAFDLEFDKQMVETSAEARKESLRKLQAETQMAISENERRAAMNAGNLREQMERILNIRADRARTEADRRRIEAQIDNIWKDSEIKRFEIELNRSSLTKSDGLYWRVLGTLINNLGLKFRN